MHQARRDKLITNLIIGGWKVQIDPRALRFGIRLICTANRRVHDVDVRLAGEFVEAVLIEVARFDRQRLAPPAVDDQVGSEGNGCRGVVRGVFGLTCGDANPRRDRRVGAATT